MKGCKANSIALLSALAACAAAQQQNQVLTPPVQPRITTIVEPAKIVLPLPPGPLKLPNIAVTANDLARIALKNQPQIAIARAAIKTAHGNVLIAEDALFPTGSIQAGFTNTYNIPFLGSASPGSTLISSGWNAGVSVSQLLFDFGRTVDNVRYNTAQEKASDFGLTAQEETTVYTVKQDFYQYVQALKTVEAAEENLKDQQYNLDLAKAELNAGLGAPADVVTAQTNVDAANVTLIQDRNSASIAEVTLALNIGIDPRTPIVPADSSGEPPIPSNDVNSLVDLALKQRPEVKQNEQLLRAAGIKVSYANKALLPSINLTAAASDDPASNFDPRTGSIGITFSWDPFDFMSARGGREIAEAAVDTAKANLQQQTLTVVSDVSQAYLNDKSAEEQVATATAELANATEGLRITEGQYKAGVTTFVTVINSELNLAQARTNLVNAQASLELARAGMEHALGKAL